MHPERSKQLRLATKPAPARDLDKAWVAATARSLGFDLCGAAPLEDWPELARYDDWLARGYAGEMRYLRDERRSQPVRLIPDARSIIVCALNYHSSRPLSTDAAAESATQPAARGWISRYAWGDDYHAVLGEKLDQLAAALREKFGEGVAARAYVDTGPVAERIAARHAGLGWLAKNTCLINEELGSWLFLGVILTSLPLAPSDAAASAPPPDLCGQCRLCLDACPTGALVEPYVLDARRCISYLTIELRGGIPDEFRAAMGWQVFGCDICQDVCPRNRSAPHTPLAAFAPRENLFAPELAWLLSMDEELFRQLFRHSAVRRAKWRGLLRNACVAAGNAAPYLDADQRSRLRAQLARLAEEGDAIITEHARWGLARLDTAQA